jgi:fucose 4-O-acetylase-like acetyltransferase
MDNSIIKRDEKIDLIKGLLILLVILGHCIYWNNSLCKIPVNNILVNIIYSFHMPLFILVSGYLFSKHKKDDLIHTAKSKFVRLIIPHLSFCIIMIPFIFVFWNVYNYYIMKESSNGIVSPKSLYNYLTMFWYLWCVFFCSIITNIIYKYFRSPHIVMFLLTILLILEYQYLHIHVFFEHQQVAIQFGFFAFGVFLYDLKKNNVSIIRKNVFVFFFLAYLFCLYLNFYVYLWKPPFIFKYLLSWCGTISFLILFYSANINLKINKYIKILSSRTLGLYIYQFPVIRALSVIVFPNSGIWVIFYDVLVTIIVLLLTLAIVKCLEKNKKIARLTLGNN